MGQEIWNVMDSFTESELHNFAESTLFERDAPTEEETFDLQSIQIIKKFIGLNPLWLEDTYPPPASPWLRSVADRTTYRRRYSGMSFNADYASLLDRYDFEYYPYEWSGSYGITTTAGDVPNETDMPYIDIDHYLAEAWGYWINDVQYLYNGDPYPEATPPVVGIKYGYVSDFFEGDTISATFSDANHTITASLSGELAFSDCLSTAVAELSAVNFETLPGDQVWGLRFSEWANSSYSADPADFDGDVYRDESMGHFYPPYFGSNAATALINCDWLWSGWMFRDAIEATSAAVTNFTHTDQIEARRTRFRSNVGRSYFLAIGTLTREPQWITASEDDIADVIVFEQGTLDADEVLEIPFPSTSISGLESYTGTTDFITTHCPTRDVDTLSCGSIVFCILDETPADWSTRTGIDYTSV